MVFANIEFEIDLVFEQIGKILLCFGAGGCAKPFVILYFPLCSLVYFPGLKVPDAKEIHFFIASPAADDRSHKLFEETWLLT